MKVALVSTYSNRRFSEFPFRHALSSQRLAAYLAATDPSWIIRLRAFAEETDPRVAVDHLLAESFDVIGLPAYIWNRSWSRRAASLLAAPAGPLIVVGGPETHTMPYCEWPEDTVFVIGQGEEPLRALVAGREAKPTLNGRTLEETDLPILSRSLDRRPTTNYERYMTRLPHGLDLFGDRYNELTEGEAEHGDFAWYESARGCIYACSFCGHNTLPFFATFDLPFVAREIANLRAAGIRRILLIDPIMGGRPARGKAILRLFRSVAPEISINAYLRPEFLDEEYVEELSQSNIAELMMGLQTTNPRIPKHVRGNNFRKILRFAPALSELGVPWRAELIVGLPGDDLTGLRESLRFTIDELRPLSVRAYHLTAIPGTQLHDLLNRTSENYWIKAGDNLRVVSSNSFDERHLEEMLTYAGAACSLYTFKRETLGRSPSFREMEDALSAILGDGSDQGILAAFRRLDIDASLEVWQRFETRPEGA
jgi:radical SAM superfamily enzyme YgiQ (UPF0313 family)